MTTELAIAVALLALIPSGPLPIAARAIVTAICGARARRRWRGTAYGLLGGIASAIAFVAVTRLASPVDVVLLAMLALLVVMDLRWRWLPLEWCGVIGLAAILRAASDGTWPDVLLAAVLVAGPLALFRFGWFRLRGIEAIGLGDIWLIAAISGHIGVLAGFGLLGIAALSGLIQHIAFKILKAKDARRYGVAYGAHICICFALLHPLFPMFGDLAT